MKPIHTFSVVPKLPPEIEALRTIAYNLRWCWSHESIELFRRLDRDLWETAGHNPVLLLGSIEQAKLEAAAKKVIAAIAEGDLLRTQMAIVRRLAKHEPVNVIALQEQIAARVIETGKYVTA